MPENEFSIQKEPLSVEEAKQRLLHWINVGRVDKLKEIFEKFQIPSELADDPIIKFKVWELRDYVKQGYQSDQREKKKKQEELDFLSEKFPNIGDDAPI